jgi:hypothetical protein
MVDNVFSKYGININTTPSPEAMKGVQGRRNLNALKDLGSWTSKEAEKAEQKRIEEEIIQKLQGYGQQLQSLDPNSSEYQRVYSEMLLAVKDVTGYIQYMKEATATPDMMAQYDNIMKGLGFANQLGAFQAATGTDMYQTQTAQPLLQYIFGGNYGQTPQQIPNVAGGLTGLGTSETSRQRTDEELWGSIVGSEKEKLDLLKYKEGLEIQKEELGIINLKADITGKLDKNKREELDAAIAYVNDMIKLATSPNATPTLAQSVLNIDNLPPVFKKTLEENNLLPTGATTIIGAAQAIVDNAANQQSKEVQEMQMKLQQLEISKGNLAVSQGQLGLSQERFNWEKQKDTLGGGANKNDFTPKMIADLGNFILLGDTSTDLAQALIANAAKQAGIKLEERVGSGYLTKLGSGQYKSPEDMWTAYKQEIQPYIRRFYSPEIEKEMVLGMIETLQARGLPIPQTMTAEAGTMGQTSNVGLSSTQDPSVTEIINTIKTMSPEEAKQGWLEDKENAMAAWRKQGKDADKLAQEIETFLSSY